MLDRSLLFAIGASLAVLLVVLELVRRRHLSEENSLLWLGTAVAMLIIGTWRDLLHSLADLVNIEYPPNLLFLLATLFLLLIQLYFSTVITRLTKENIETAQEIALLRHELEQLSAQKNDRDHAEQPNATV